MKNQEEVGTCQVPVLSDKRVPPLFLRHLLVKVGCKFQQKGYQMTSFNQVPPEVVNTSQTGPNL
jgi:hypothetical protein